MKHSSQCADGLRIFIKPTRHHVRRALLKNVVPRWTTSARFIYYRAASLWITQQCRSKGELCGLMSAACLAQGESDVGQMEDTVLSVPSAEERSRYQKNVQPFRDANDNARHEAFWPPTLTEKVTDKTDRNKKKMTFFKHILLDPVK